MHSSLTKYFIFY